MNVVKAHFASDTKIAFKTALIRFSTISFAFLISGVLNFPDHSISVLVLSLSFLLSSPVMVAFHDAHSSLNSKLNVADARKTSTIAS
jgi:hypothetical protein